MDSLSRPAAALCHSLTPLPPETSLRRAAEIMNEEGLPALPVADPGFVYGAISQRDLLRAAANGADLTEAVIDWTDGEAARIGSHQPAADAFRKMEDEGRDWLMVVDPAQNAVGILTPALLTGSQRVTARPHMVGGMATPMGVYLTNGIIGAGVTPWALVLTGMLLISFFVIGALITNGLLLLVPESALSPQWRVTILDLGAIVFFLAGLRFAPLAGIHAAEHKVVHAIERGEELTPDIVKRMPRVHPRCGTNIAVGAMVFLGIMSLEFIPDMELRLVAAMVVTLTVWKPLGSLMQFYVTTREPNDAQIAMGIKSGRELLEKSLYAPQVAPGFLKRLQKSGIFLIMAGALIIQGVLYLVSLMLPPHWQVF